MRQRLVDWTATGLMVALIPMLLFVAATSASAARRSSATLTITPNHAQAWSTATGSGCGYGSSDVYVDIEKPEAQAFLAVVPDADGCIGFTFNTDGPGTYTVETRQLLSGRHWRTLATYSLPVE